MYFKQLKIGGYDKNLSYLVGDEGSKEVMVVDPDNLAMIEKVIEGDQLQLKGILITHEHHDHVVGVPEMVERYDVPVFIHGAGKEAVQGCGGVVKEVSDGDVIKVGGVEIKVLHTPGHARGAVCYLVEGKLITGDTVFVGGCGRCDLNGSDIDAMYDTLFNKLWKLPDETEIYPGHDYGDRSWSTWGEEKKSNRFLVCGSKDEFVKERMG